MGHNAVVRSGNGEVIGKLSVSKLQDLPKDWEVIYGSSFIPRRTELEDLFCDRKFPLSIYTAGVEREITVKSADLEDFKLVVDKHDSILTLKQLIYERTSIEMGHQKLFHDYGDDENSELEDVETFDNFLFQRKCTIRFEKHEKRKPQKIKTSNNESTTVKNEKTMKKNVELYNPIKRRINKGRVNEAKTFKKKKISGRDFDDTFIGDWRNGNGGGGRSVFMRDWPLSRVSKRPWETFKTVDLQAQHVDGTGISVKNEWEGYSLGLNIYGTCPKQSCPSHKIPCGQTTHRAGYGFLRIDLNYKEFPCPACKGTFPPTNFVVSSGRALFRFRKTGGRYEVQSSLLESFGGINEYAMFHNEGQEEEAEYDWIEVKTVKEDASLHTCVRCDKQIKKKTDAVLYECSHPVHRSCLEETCCVCRAKVLTGAQVKALTSTSRQQSQLDSPSSAQANASASTSRQQSKLVLINPTSSSESESD